LILILYWNYAPTMTAVAGFESNAACQATGQEWSAAQSGKHNFVCGTEKVTLNAGGRGLAGFSGGNKT
jgi:hypothetical protein